MLLTALGIRYMLIYARNRSQERYAHNDHVNDRSFNRLENAMTDIEQVAAKAQTFHGQHAGPGMLVLVNAWDAASAQHFEAAGFASMATTSGGVASALGYADHEGAPVDEMLGAAARIIRAVSVPVTVDFEAGYGLSPAEIARRLIDIGAVGLNLEDTDHHGTLGMVPADVQAEHLAAVKAEARALGVDLFLNARVDVFIRGEGSMDSQLAEGLRRARIYREAGADCIYPIGLSDLTAIRALVDAVQVINVTVRRGGPVSLAAAAHAGVRRVTYATSIFRETMNALDQIAADIRASIPVEGSGLTR
jgi:2-methylisocitrate lyase-like PEP mutase family enzyme